MSGVAIGFVERGKKDDLKKKDSSTDRDMVFTMEEVQAGSGTGDILDKSITKSKQIRQPPFFSLNAK